MTPERQAETQRTPNPTWWSNSARNFVLQNDRGQYINVSADMFRKHLRRWGFSTRAAPDELIAPADDVMLDVQTILIELPKLVQSFR